MDYPYNKKIFSYKEILIEPAEHIHARPWVQFPTLKRGEGVGDRHSCMDKLHRIAFV